MSLLDDLYQASILEHNRRPHNYGRLDPHDVAEEGHNPSCGDELTLYLSERDGKLTTAFEGHGCAISRASASMLTDLVNGRDVPAARRLAEHFRAMIHGGEAHPALGEALALQGVSRLHARVKCATLAWVTLEQALDELERSKSS